MSRDDELAELLSALLDGELDPAEEREVRDLLDRSPAARAELNGLTRVRLLVRDLADVEPPAGFLESVTPASARAGDAGPARRRGEPTDLDAVRAERARRRDRSRARRWPKVTAAIVAAAAAIVLVLGLTPVTDKVVPPVSAYAERHLAMVDPAASSPAPSSFTPVPAAELDQAGAPAHLAEGFDRMGGYHTTDGVMHLMYEKGDEVVSVYVQRGRVAWDGLPANGTMATLGTDTGWEMDGPAEDVVVVERGSMVYTVVATDGHDGMMDVLHSMPEPPAPPMMDRVRDACHRIVERVGLGD